MPFYYNFKSVANYAFLKIICIVNIHIFFKRVFNLFDRVNSIKIICALKSDKRSIDPSKYTENYILIYSFLFGLDLFLSTHIFLNKKN